jgi:hypothetical protein
VNSAAFVYGTYPPQRCVDANVPKAHADGIDHIQSLAPLRQ